ncbi:MAG TPA: 4'-phosphopantetheinyl transferase superfamily protein [Solirubrobacteraceae bacterium]|nr:4'-phosphopantetheinyl transferase superfamily protein [Solirubrobacteraceae bacterium]
MAAWLEIDTHDAPRVALIDATLEGLDEAELRTRARTFGAAVGAGNVSRSYCHPYALIGWHSGPIGVDIERVVACPEEFSQATATPAEQASGRWRTDEELISLWSSKEALSKALGDALDYDPRRLESPGGWPRGVCVRWRTAVVPVPDGHCAWVCWRMSEGQPASSRRLSTPRFCIAR